MQFNTISRELFDLETDDEVTFVKGYLPIGVDLAKYNIEVYCYNFKSNKFKSRTLSREQFKSFLNESEHKLLVSFESGGSSHYWARYCISCGHKVRLITTRFVSSVRDKNKDDKHDAKLIYLAALTLGCRTTGVKSEKEQMLYTILKLRDQLLKDRVKLTNFWRATIYEMGEPIKGNLISLKQHTENLAIDSDNVRTDTKDLIAKINGLCSSQIDELNLKVKEIDDYLKGVARTDADCALLMTIHGVSEISATVIMTSLSNIGNFPDGPHYASLIGFAPRHRGTGGSNYNISAGPTGHKSIKKCYFFAAMAIYRQVKNIEEQENCWLHRIVKEKGGKTAICAIANRLACTAYSMLKNKTPFDMERFKGKYLEVSKQKAS